MRDQRAAHQQQIAAIEAQFQRQLADMQAQRAALQSQIASLVRESFRARSSGKWRWPIDGVITQGFGCTSYPFEPYDPSCPSRHFHSGLDIATDYGTAVHAADGGIVHNFAMGCSWNPSALCGYGRYVVMVHAGGVAPPYRHLSRGAGGQRAPGPPDNAVGYQGSNRTPTRPPPRLRIALPGPAADPPAHLP